MARIAIHEHSKEWAPAVRSFNERLADGGSEFSFPELPAESTETQNISQTRYLATEGEHVRGGFILKWQDFSFGGDVHRIAHLKLPLSEGIVDKKYARVGLQIIRQALKTEPLLFCLGMGGVDRPLPTMLAALRWRVSEVPFLFRANRGGAFARNILPLRTTPGRKQAFDLAAATGVAHVGLRAIHFGQSLRRIGIAALARSATRSEPIVGNFGDRADELWRSCRNEYPMSAVRDASVLNELYPTNTAFIRLRVIRDGYMIGWVVGLDSQLTNHKQFGDMRLGSIVDCFSHPDDSATVVHAMTRELRRRGVDLLISNQAHSAWQDALLDDGYLEGPSNFAFAASPKLSALIPPESPLHLNRGDGDGPINL